MRIDGRTIPPDVVVETDVCVIGAGAAGIAVARALGGREFRVALLESGGFEPRAGTQALYEGPVTGRSYYPLDRCRARYFGGTTNLWNGWCRPLDPVDFESRPGLPYSGWPLSREALEPYYRRAQRVCGLGPFRYDPEAWTRPDEPGPLPLSGDDVRTTVFQVRARRFAEAYREEILQAPNLTLYLHSNVVAFDVPEGRRAVRRVKVRTAEGGDFWISGKIFVLATGGIENARLLMASGRHEGSRVVDEAGLVGRCFAEHLHVEGGSFVPAGRRGDASFYHLLRRGEIRINPVLAVTRRRLQRTGMLNFSVALVPIWHRDEIFEEARKSRGFRSLRSLVRMLRGDEPAAAGEVGEHLGNVLADLYEVGVGLYGMTGAERVEGYALLVRSEQSPNRASRVHLTDERDALGVPVAGLEWRLRDLDLASIRAGLEAVAVALGKAELGRIRLPAEGDREALRDAVVGGHHHMGTTRMSADPARGVVDPDCRVHGIDNLYVAGSSVFPSSGFSNPTLTLVALALRLADRIAAIMDRGR